VRFSHQLFQRQSILEWRDAQFDEVTENRVIGVEEHSLEIIERELFELLLVTGRKQYLFTETVLLPPFLHADGCNVEEPSRDCWGKGNSDRHFGEIDGERGTINNRDYECLFMQYLPCSSQVVNIACTLISCTLIILDFKT